MKGWQGEISDTGERGSVPGFLGVSELNEQNVSRIDRNMVSIRGLVQLVLRDNRPATNWIYVGYGNVFDSLTKAIQHPSECLFKYDLIRFTVFDPHKLTNDPKRQLELIRQKVEPSCLQYSK